MKKRLYQIGDRKGHPTGALKQPLAVTLLERRAKANAKGQQPGYAEEDGVRCHYYPRSKTSTFWIFSVKRPKAAVVEHFRFRDVFRKQA